MKSGSGETDSKLMLFNAYVMIVNILSIVSTKQCLLSYRALLSWIYLSQHKDNPIKTSYAVIFYSVLDIPL